MTTEEVYVKNDGTGFDAVESSVDSFIEKIGFPLRSVLHIKLLTEEMLGMVKAITRDFEALFWIEGDASECDIRLRAKVEMDPVKRRGLMSISTSGKNIFAKGIMGKIRELVEIGMENYDDVGKLQKRYGVAPVSYGMMGVNSEMMSQAVVSWSLKQYRDNVSDSRDENEVNEVAWDELEKSIIANIADDVQVGIMKDKVELIITKRFV